MSPTLERFLHANVKCIPPKLRRLFGWCKCGHPDYVTDAPGCGDQDCQPEQDWSGDNVGIRTGKYDYGPYCLACHRAQQAEQEIVIFPGRFQGYVCPTPGRSQLLRYESGRAESQQCVVGMYPDKTITAPIGPVLIDTGD